MTKMDANPPTDDPARTAALYLCNLCGSGWTYLTVAQKSRCRARCRQKPPEKQPGDPPKIDLHGVDGVDESSCPHPTKPRFHPTSATLRRWRGQATLMLGLIATSETISAPLKGQEGQRCEGAPSSSSCGRRTAPATAAGDSSIDGIFGMN